MKSLLLAVAVVASLGVAGLSFVDAVRDDERVAPVERTVYVLDDPGTVQIKRTDVVRVTGEAIAGGSVSAKVTGPARIVAENSIVRVVDGRALIGAAPREFEIRPTGTGAVVVTITIDNPTSDRPTKEEYKITVR